MSRKQTCTILLCIFMFATSSCLSSCASPPKEQATRPEQPVEAAPTPASTPPQNVQPLEAETRVQEKQPANLPPPKPSEVKEAITRVFQQVVTQDTDHNPSFVVGDFNGDGSEDLAVSVKPNNEGMLMEINNELANWIFEDPKKVSIPGKTPTSQGASANKMRARAEKGDTLLAIIHGYGPKGWRNPEAKQTYLLKNGAGAGMRAQKAASLRDSKEPLPLLRGDAIRETIGGDSGFLIWTGAKYAWYLPGLK